MRRVAAVTPFEAMFFPQTGTSSTDECNFASESRCFSPLPDACRLAGAIGNASKCVQLVGASGKVSPWGGILLPRSPQSTQPTCKVAQERDEGVPLCAVKKSSVSCEAFALFAEGAMACVQSLGALYRSSSPWGGMVVGGNTSSLGASRCSIGRNGNGTSANPCAEMSTSCASFIRTTDDASTCIASTLAEKPSQNPMHAMLATVASSAGATECSIHKSSGCLSHSTASHLCAGFYARGDGADSCATAMAASQNESFPMAAMLAATSTGPATPACAIHQTGLPCAAKVSGSCAAFALTTDGANVCVQSLRQRTSSSFPWGAMIAGGATSSQRTPNCNIDLAGNGTAQGVCDKMSASCVSFTRSADGALSCITSTQTGSTQSPMHAMVVSMATKTGVACAVHDAIGCQKSSACTAFSVTGSGATFCAATFQNVSNPMSAMLTSTSMFSLAACSISQGKSLCEERRSSNACAIFALNGTGTKLCADSLGAGGRSSSPWSSMIFTATQTVAVNICAIGNSAGCERSTSYHCRDFVLSGASAETCATAIVLQSSSSDSPFEHMLERGNPISAVSQCNVAGMCSARPSPCKHFAFSGNGSRSCATSFGLSTRREAGPFAVMLVNGVALSRSCTARGGSSSTCFTEFEACRAFATGSRDAQACTNVVAGTARVPFAKMFLAYAPIQLSCRVHGACIGSTSSCEDFGRSGGTADASACSLSLAGGTLAQTVKQYSPFSAMWAKEAPIHATFCSIDSSSSPCSNVPQCNLFQRGQALAEDCIFASASSKKVGSTSPFNAMLQRQGQHMRACTIMGSAGSCSANPVNCRTPQLATSDSSFKDCVVAATASVSQSASRDILASPFMFMIQREQRARDGGCAVQSASSLCHLAPASCSAIQLAEGTFKQCGASDTGTRTGPWGAMLAITARAPSAMCSITQYSAQPCTFSSSCQAFEKNGQGSTCAESSFASSNPYAQMLRPTRTRKLCAISSRYLSTTLGCTAEAEMSCEGLPSSEVCASEILRSCSGESVDLRCHPDAIVFASSHTLTQTTTNQCAYGEYSSQSAGCVALSSRRNCSAFELRGENATSCVNSYLDHCGNSTDLDCYNVGLTMLSIDFVELINYIDAKITLDTIRIAEGSSNSTGLQLSYMPEMPVTVSLSVSLRIHIVGWGKEKDRKEIELTLCTANS